ncbi:SDR family NAD(P)-dependent oxidoreductase [Cuniculiplasma sp. SKW4]|uniref:SDR family NAD(P)-dependent oxidoreductase n=1 Tax=Cuniculiplasma sp. SKW4 TaxID=3400171 RepID=UPI003FD610AB
MDKNYVLVTGSTGGLGSAISFELARKGFNLLLHYNNNSRDAKSLEQQLIKSGIGIELVSADLSRLDGPGILSEEIINKGIRLSGIVNNAGIGRPGNDATVEDDDWDAVCNVNLRAPVLLLKKLLKVMDRPSSVVNIASAAGLRVGATSISYEASKAGLIHATRSMALTLAPDIRVNAVAPGFVKTNMTSKNLSNEKVLNGILARTPMKRIGTPEDIAKLVGFLISDDSSFITGETVVIDGGITLS